MQTYDIVEIIIYAVILVSVVAFQDYRLKKVEKRLDEHNHYAQMFSDTKKDIELMKNEIEHINYYAEEHYKAIMKLYDKERGIK